MRSHPKGDAFDKHLTLNENRQRVLFPSAEKNKVYGA